MSVLRRKLRRDLWALRGQVAAIVAVMACGLATFVMALSMLASLEATLERTYERGRFAHVFVHLERAPRSIVDRVAGIPGVAAVEGRVAEGVRLLVPDFDEPVAARVVSLPESEDGLNLVHVRRGRLPSAAWAASAEAAGSMPEVLLNEAFAAAHGLRPGDRIDIVLNGRRQSVRIAGTGLSPEFIYHIAPGSMLPDDERFGVLWMHRRDVAAAFDMEGAVNDLLVRLTPGASEPAVLEAIDAVTDPHGGTGAYARADQSSHRFIANEIEELSGTATVVPGIFLVVSTALLNIVLVRLVSVQREQIAVLRALGRTRTEIALHHLGLGLLVGGLSTLTGVGLGAAAGLWMTGVYAEFFRFPEFEYRLPPRVLLAAAAVAGAASVLAVLHAVAAAVRLQPAEAMRPRPPASFRPTALSRLGVHGLLPPAGRMVLRQLERHPVRSLASAVGIAMAVAILVVGGAVQDGVEATIERQFTLVERHDMTVVMTDTTDARMRGSLAAVPGVRRVELFRTVPVRIRAGTASRLTSIRGLEEADGLHRMQDADGRPMTLPSRGLVLSSTLAEVLGVAPGDTVQVEILEQDRRVVSMEVSATIRDIAGLSATCRLDALAGVLPDRHAADGAFLLVDAAARSRVLQELREMPRVAGVTLTEVTRRSFRETFGESLGIVQGVLVGFAVVIGFGVVYNAARISLAERSRDLATLRVIGFSRGEIDAIQLGELAALTVAALGPGLLAGTALAYAASAATDSEMFRLPFTVHPSTYGTAMLVTLGTAVLSGVVVRRRLRRLDLVQVLKARE